MRSQNRNPFCHRDTETLRKSFPTPFSSVTLCLGGQLFAFSSLLKFERGRGDHLLQRHAALGGDPLAIVVFRRCVQQRSIHAATSSCAPRRTASRRARVRGRAFCAAHVVGAHADRRRLAKDQVDQRRHVFRLAQNRHQQARPVLFHLRRASKTRPARPPPAPARRSSRKSAGSCRPRSFRSR